MGASGVNTSSQLPISIHVQFTQFDNLSKMVSESTQTFLVFKVMVRALESESTLLNK